ncbi:hypothetical protein P3T76_013243 [Phytophthora citrophthora]|uniref:Uncharacterized protein n=1 Tax=Phytophthora citrophthora TaxID=4793 RepID=A0AAD9G2Z7_9STRA|nr:hypothetical protein P3T76_013243 [Phytophthora citrophthora]
MRLACPSVRSVLCCFFAAYNAKFRSQRPLGPENVAVYVEFHKIGPHRHLVESLDVSVAAVGNSNYCTDKTLLASSETCDFELIVVPTEPQRKVLGPELPPELKSKKKCPFHAEISEEDGRDLKLRGILELADRHMRQRKFRAAREIYTHVVASDPWNSEALVALGDILAANGRHEEAVEMCFIKCWKAHKGKECGCKAQARLTFTSALRLVECYLELEKFNEAVAILEELQIFVRQNGGSVGGEVKSRGFFTDASERVCMEEQMDVLKAQALYESKTFENQEKAISLLMHILPDLTASALNLKALLMYARIAYDRGKKDEALSMALRVLVGRSNDRVVKKTIVAFLKDPESMQRLQQAVPPNSPSAGAAYAFIATILKDFGAVEKSILCFQQAQNSDPRSASYALNRAHVLEISCRYTEAYNVLVSFFRENRALDVGKGGATLDAGSFVKILDDTVGWEHRNTEMLPDKLQKTCHSSDWHVEWKTEKGGYAKVSESGAASGAADGAPLNLGTMQANKGASSASSEAELDLMACFFTIVKILFVNGKLSALSALIRVLEPIRLGRDLHQTSIRNEAAYYTCIAQLLSIQNGLVRNLPEVVSSDVIYVCGDSHTLATAWREISTQGHPTLLHPALVTGLKHWHLRQESTFYPKENFWRVVANIPSKARVIFLFGEIDCREGILDAVEKCKYETIEEGMIHTIGIFMETLAVVVEKYEFDVYIHPVVPVLDETRLLVIQYNKLFRERVDKSPICRWLDFFDELICGSPPKLRPDFKLDGTHLHPSYLVNLETAINRISDAKS